MAYDWGDGKGRVHSKPIAQHLLAIGQAPAPQKGIPAGAPGSTGPNAAPGSSAAAPFIPDAQYLASAAQQAHDRQAALDQYGLAKTQDQAATQQAIQRLVDKAPNDRQTIDQGANKAGLFYSGQLTKNLTDYNKQLQQQQDDANTGYKNRQDARDAAIKAIQSGAPLQDAMDLASAGDRQIARDTTAADNQALVPNPAAAPAAAGATLTQPHTATRGANAGQQFTVQLAPGGVFHVYPDGRRVFVKS